MCNFLKFFVRRSQERERERESEEKGERKGRGGGLSKQNKQVTRKFVKLCSPSKVINLLKTTSNLMSWQTY